MEKNVADIDPTISLVGVGVLSDVNSYFDSVDETFCLLTRYSSEELLKRRPCELIQGYDNHIETFSEKVGLYNGIVVSSSSVCAFFGEEGREVLVEYHVTRIHSSLLLLSVKAAERNDNFVIDRSFSYEEIVANSADGILIVQDRQFCFANNAFFEIFGYSEAEFKTMGFIDVIHQEDRYMMRFFHQERMNGAKQSFIYTVRGLTKAGAVIFLEINTSFVNYRGRIAALAMVRDCSRRKTFDASLVAAEASYKHLFDVRSEVKLLVARSTGKILDVNEGALLLYGYSWDEFLRLAVSDIFIDARGDWDALLEEPTSSVVYHRRKGGGVFPVEMSGMLSEYEGQSAVLIVVHDVSNRILLEEAFAKSEARYRTLINQMRDGILIVQDKRIVLVNHTLVDLMGHSSSGDQNKTDGVTFFTPNDWQRILAAHERRVKGEVFSEEYLIVFEGDDRVKRTIEVNTIGIEYENRPATFVSLRDTTRHTSMQNALRRSEKKFRDLSSFLPQTIFEINLQGEVVYLNNSGFKVLGVVSSDLGFHFLRHIEWSNNYRLRRKFFQLVRHGVAVEDECIILRSDSKCFPAIIYISAIVEEGVKVGYRGLIVDISRRKDVEVRLEKSERQYRHLITCMQEGLFVLKDECFVFVNDAMTNIVGYSHEEIIGKHYMFLTPPERREDAERNCSQFVSQKLYSKNYEFEMMHKDGVTRVPVLLSMVVSEFDDKPVIVGTAKDITDRIRYEYEIKLAHEELARINSELERQVKEQITELDNANNQLLMLQKENIQSQFDVLKQQVNPHFLFNSLNVLASLIRIEPELAEQFTEYLSRVYRYVLENKDHDFVSLDTELDFLHAYLFLLKIRFSEKIIVRIEIPESKKYCNVIPLAIQLLIENAIKHNSMSKKNPLVIELFVDEFNYLNVVNNLQVRETQIATTGVGLRNIRSRYKLLTSHKTEFFKRDDHFVARIPLME